MDTFGRTLLDTIRPEAARAPASRIVDAMTYGRGRPGMIPLWAGEGDRPTPAFITDAAAQALADGETFYTWQRGIPELRDALVGYHERLYGGTFDRERFTITTGGMHAVQMATRIVAGPGDEILIPTPMWPNFHGAALVVGAVPVSVPMVAGPEGWSLDFDRLRAAVTERTRAIVINSPSNPTGWTATLDDLRAVLDFARANGLWIIADEIYARFVYGLPAIGGQARAPSFHDVMDASDRVLFVQSFSKNWAMTGWRVGWLEAPAALGPILDNLVQYSTSGLPAFLQRAAVTAITDGEPFVAEMIAAARRGRDIVCDGLRSTGLVDLPSPPGAFYAFFRVPGAADTMRLTFDLIDRANVGLAPGTAFGEGADEFLRLCFLRRADDLQEAVTRLASALPAALRAGANDR